MASSEPPADRDTLTALARELRNGALPLPNVATGGQPSPGTLARLAAAGLRTVVDLRLVDEPRDFDEAAEVARLGMRYVNIPVSYDGLGAPEFDRLREILSTAADGPVLVHCASANRVGALLFPYLVLDEGRERDEAFDLACAIGLSHPGIADAAYRYLDNHEGV